MNEKVARIIHISALSQTLIELIEGSVYEPEYKRIVRRQGEKFVSLLDKKLNYMLGEDKSAEQVLNYSTLLDDGLKEAEKELIEILTKNKK
jgi:hypothetical protein